jgi:hypothetical protein
MDRCTMYVTYFNFPLLPFTSGTTTNIQIPTELAKKKKNKETIITDIPWEAMRTPTLSSARLPWCLRERGRGGGGIEVVSCNEVEEGLSLIRSGMHFTCERRDAKTDTR